MSLLLADPKNSKTTASHRPDIALVMSPMNARDSYMPLYFLYLAGYLEKKGFRTAIIDTHERDLEANNKIILKRLQALQPRYVGMACFVTDYDVVLDLARRIKKVVDAKIIVGNAQPSVCPEDFLVEGTPFDIVVRGEGELPLEAILSGDGSIDALRSTKGIAFLDKGSPILTPAQELMDLNDCGMPAYNQLDMNWYRRGSKFIIRRLYTIAAVVYTGRGCPFKCTFCAANTVWQSNLATPERPVVRKRPLDAVMKELHLLQDTYHYDFFYILDDTFGVKEDDILNFCKAYRESGLRMMWGAETRANCIRNPEIVRTLKESGCLQLDFGVEAGSQRMLNNVRKGIKVKNVVEAFDLCKQNGVRTFANILVNLPGEEEEDLREMEELLNRIQPSFTSFGVTQPYPGTEMVQKLGIPVTREDYPLLNRQIPDEKFRLSRHKLNLYRLVSLLEIKHRTVAPFDTSVLKAGKDYWKTLLTSPNVLRYFYFIVRDLVTYPISFAYFVLKRLGVFLGPRYVDTDGADLDSKGAVSPS